MSRINTNVSSLVAQTALARSNSDLQTALNRLSTGLRINAGKDDPAGLIASENLRRDINSIGRAIGNTERANQLIATADSALGQVSSLLNDIRGLATEAANKGALSDEQIAANQLQVDSSLEAIDRIAQVTTFQGRRLLDGSLDFIVSGNTNYDKISNLQVQQANLGTTGTVSVDVNVAAAATQAQVDLTNIPADTAAVNAFGDVALTHVAAQALGAVALTHADTQASGAFTLASSGDTITVTALDGGAAQDASGNAIDVLITDAGPGGPTSVTFAAGVLTVDIDLAAAGSDDVAAAITAFNGGVDFTASSDGTTALAAGDDINYAAVTSGGRDGGDATIAVTADTAGAAENGTTVTILEDNTIANNSAVASIVAGNIEVAVRGTVTYSAIATAIDGLAGYGASISTSSGDQDYVQALDTPPAASTLSGGRDVGDATIRVVSDTAGAAANGTTVTILEDNTIANNSAVASIVSGNLEVAVRGTVTYSAIAAALDGLTGYTASVTSSSGDQNYIDANDTPPAAASLGSGVDAGGGLTQDVVFELGGLSGSEVFSFQAGTRISQINSAINAISDATGVTATVNSTTLELTSSAYGSKAFVDIKVVSEAAGGTIKAAVGQGTRDTGTDVDATVNGLQATGNGNSLELNSATLDLSLDVTAAFTGSIDFDITGGGELFQLGPSVVSNQQARLGINSVNTATLGGTAGRLYELRTGEARSLSNDVNSAALIVDQVITKVTELRGRLGAFQKTTLESNLAALNDTLGNLTQAQSSIRDADFAKESAQLTRAQILVQSGTAVLTIANQNPQNVLSLLRQ